jgi:hypothetical protein
MRTAVRRERMRPNAAVHTQGRSFSGLRMAQMCLIRSSATSNANTVTVTPSCWGLSGRHRAFPAVRGAEPASGVASTYLNSATRSMNLQPAGVRR